METASATVSPVVRYNGQLMAEDMAAQTLTKQALAKRARVADMTVIRFLRGDHQTVTTAGKLARALGKPVRRYIVPEPVARDLARGA